jgi:rare lipoprotein A (peptidoglycan hydrolase)
MLLCQNLHVLTKFTVPLARHGYRRWCISAVLAPAVLLANGLGESAIADTMRVGWYGPGFEGDYTASGEVFSRDDYTAAHPSWPFGTLVQLTNPNSGATVVVRVNDRSGGALDITEQAARDLETYQIGISAVEVEILQWGEQGGE